MTGEGIDQLLEMRRAAGRGARPQGQPEAPRASGTVLEALLDKGRGPVARVLVQDGTLRVGDFVLAGPGFGKVRAMTNEHGKQLQEAGPSTPVEILGLSDVPGAGDPMHAVKDAEEGAGDRREPQGQDGEEPHPGDGARSRSRSSRSASSDSDQHELRVIIKGDVQGSVEAVADALAKLSTEKVQPHGHPRRRRRDHRGRREPRHRVEGDHHRLQRAPGRQGGAARRGEQDRDPPLLDHLQRGGRRAARDGRAPPGRRSSRRSNGKAEVRAVFKVKGGVVAGSYVREGKIMRVGQVRLLRDGAVIWDGKIAALKRFKDDVKEVAEGFECGISLEGFNDIKEKDIIECYEIEEVKQKL